MSTSFVGRRLPPPTVRVRREALRVPLALQLLWAVVKLLVKVVLVVAGSPVLLGIAAASVLAWSLWVLTGPTVLACAVLLVVAGLLGLRHWSPARFAVWVQAPLRSRWRRFSVYRYKWPATMDMVDLNRRRSDGSAFEPRLLRVRSTTHGDLVHAKMLAGQTLEEWAKASDGLCQTFGAQSCRVASVPNRPHEVALWFLTRDPLVEVVEPAELMTCHKLAVPEVRSTSNLAALPVGMTEAGSVYRLPLLGNHLLLCGATGAGKSSVEWAIVHALAPAIADRTVRLWGVDPKRMELGFGEALFESVVSDMEDIADLLEDAVQLMRLRQSELRGFTRTHSPTAEDPLLVVLIDELAALAYITERDLKRRIDMALGLLLSQGRAVGVCVIGCTQDPRKEVVAQRGLYPVRVALRLTEADDVALVLGRGAYDRGARCDEIPESLQGVGFVQVDGVAEPVRVRFAHVTDEHIRALAAPVRPSRLSLVSGDPDAVADLPEPLQAA